MAKVADKIINLLFESVDPAPKAPFRIEVTWERERRFEWGSWTFGVWAVKFGRKRARGIDLGPVAWIWTEQKRRVEK